MEKQKATAVLLPVEIIGDILCRVISSHYWSYFIDGNVVYQEQIVSTNDLDDSQRENRREWDPIVAMSGINLIFRDQTLSLGARLLGIPRAVDGRLLEHPSKVILKVFAFCSLLRPHVGQYWDRVDDTTLQGGQNHPLLGTEASPHTFFPPSHPPPSNPWSDPALLMDKTRAILNGAYISRSPFLRGHIAVLIGKSALATLSFGEVVRVGFSLRRVAPQDDGDAGAVRRTDTDGAERSPAAHALEIMNRAIPSLTIWTPKQAAWHLKSGLFSVAYSTHTISTICGIIGVITSCTKLLAQLRAVEAIAGIDEDRRRSMQTATRACKMSLEQLYTCESSSYQTYRPLSTPDEPPPWPGHIIRHQEILKALVLAGHEDLFPESKRWAILRAAILFRIRVDVPELSRVFPDELVKTLRGEPSEKYAWGTVEHSQWTGDRQKLLELWYRYKQEYVTTFGMEKLEEPRRSEVMF